MKSNGDVTSQLVVRPNIGCFIPAQWWSNLVIRVFINYLGEKINGLCCVGPWSLLGLYTITFDGCQFHWWSWIVLAFGSKHDGLVKLCLLQQWGGLGFKPLDGREPFDVIVNWRGSGPIMWAQFKDSVGDIRG